MKFLLWILVSLAALLWTGLAWLGASLLGALSSQAGGMQDLGQVISSMPIPAWMGWWLDTQILEATRNALVGLMDWMGHWAPDLGTLVSWLQAVIWVGWGLGMTLLLGSAALGHWVIGRLSGGRMAHTPLVRQP